MDVKFGGNRVRFTTISLANRGAHRKRVGLRTKRLRTIADMAEDAKTGATRLRRIRLISGGQTGADRAALDFALAHGLGYGGVDPERQDGR